MKRILFIESNRDGTVGGSYYSLLYLMQGLNKSKYELHVLFCQDNMLVPEFKKVTPHVYINNFGPSQSIPVETFTDVLKWPYRVLDKLLLKQFALKKIIDEIKPDLVHLNNGYACMHEWMLACALWGIKVLAHDRGTEYPCNRQTKLFVRLVDVIMCVSDSFKGNVVRQHLKPKRIRRVYDGIRVDAFHDIAPSASAQVKKEFGIADGQFAVGIVGNIIRWKGQLVVLQAIKEVKKVIPDIKCLIMGKVAQRSEDYKKELDDYVLTHGLEKNIIFTGFRTDIPDILSVLNILIHASIDPEPFGLVVLEGMAMRKPVIATNVGGPAEIVLQNETGVLVPANDPESMADAIVYCLSNKDKANEMGERGRQRFVEMFSSDKMVEETEKVYEEIFQQRESPQVLRGQVRSEKL
jgi:glycosyltransferase involved in cell wall biosynthesis